MPREDFGMEIHSFPGNVDPSTFSPAEARIARMANIEVDTSELDTFLNRAGRITYGAGRVVASGSLAVTYVDARDMGKMIEAKFPGIHREPKKIKNLHSRLRKDFQSFVRSQGRIIDHDITIRVVEPDAGDPGLTMEAFAAQQDAYEEEQAKLKVCSERLWHDADIAVSGIMLVGKNDLAFSFGDSQVLREERREVVNYLEAEGLRARQVVDADWEPHATFYYPWRAFNSLRMPERPDEISLDAPAMLIK